MKVTPTWVATFETNTQSLIQDAWARMSKNLVWDKFMDVRKSATLRELYFWLLETARINDEQQGGQKRFDDIAALSYEIDNRNSGAGLRLTKNEIEDNVMSGGSLRGMPALDYAASWARQMGGSAGYWPQELFFNLLGAGETATGYDGKAFFAKDHPINPYNTGSGTYSNLLNSTAGSTAATDPNDAIYPGACPIDTTNASTLADAFTNFGKAVAYIRALKQPNGKPRNLVVRYALVGVTEQKRINEILDTKFYGSGAGATENVVSRYGIEPVVASELTTMGEYYLACEMMAGEGGPFVFQDRDPYVLTSYQPETQAELQRRKEFEWSFDGRNAGAYGHPYLFFKVKPT